MIISACLVYSDLVLFCLTNETCKCAKEQGDATRKI